MKPLTFGMLLVLRLLESLDEPQGTCISTRGYDSGSARGLVSRGLCSERKERIAGRQRMVVKLTDLGKKWLAEHPKCPACNGRGWEDDDSEQDPHGSFDPEPCSECSGAGYVNSVDTATHPPGAATQQ